MIFDGKKRTDREKMKEVMERHPNWPQIRQYFSDMTYWRGRYIWCQLNEKVLEVATQYQIRQPGEFEVDTLYAGFDSLSTQEQESGLRIRHRSGGNVTLRVAANGIVLRLGNGLGGVERTAESIMIVPEDVTTEDIEGWFKKILEGK